MTDKKPFTTDEAFQQEISHYKRAKGTIQFPLDEPIPYDFVEKIVTFLMQKHRR